MTGPRLASCAPGPRCDPAARWPRSGGTRRDALRGLVAVAAGVAAVPLPAAGQALRLPMRNLIVEVRQDVDEAGASQRAGITGGSVVIGNGGVRGQAGVEWRTDHRDQSAGTVQQVLVLNGGQAAVRVAAQTPWQFVQVAWTPQGPRVVPALVWAESATGFRVRPAWPGGQEPVTVEFTAEAAQPGGGLPGDRAGPAAQAVVLTTVQVPLDEWVTVARSLDAQRSEASGVLSSRSAERASARSLQIRVRAP